ncbi:MAG TPA: hypothetical protein PKD75_05235 [Tepidiformaceae bacterium]|nr:hypothetical protein [Tepidiformaceae bacterium]
MSKLLAGPGERWARDSASEQIDLAAELPGREVPQVSLKHVPLWPIVPQSGACERVDFDKGQMAKARLFESQRLAARASANLKRRQFTLHTSTRNISQHIRSIVGPILLCSALGVTSSRRSFPWITSQQASLTNNPERQVLGILAGGGMEKIHEGFQKLIIMRTRPVHEYMHRSNSSAFATARAHGPEHARTA